MALTLLFINVIIGTDRCSDIRTSILVETWFPLELYTCERTTVTYLVFERCMILFCMRVPQSIATEYARSVEINRKVRNSLDDSRRNFQDDWRFYLTALTFPTAPNTSAHICRWNTSEQTSFIRRDFYECTLTDFRTARAGIYSRMPTSTMASRPIISRYFRSHWSSMSSLSNCWWTWQQAQHPVRSLPCRCYSRKPWCEWFERRSRQRRK